METLFCSGLVADLVLALLAAEALWLARAGRLREVMPVLLAGAGFALALRGALTGAAWPWVAAPLAAAGAAHLWDLARRR